MAIQAELRLGIRDFNANLDRATQNVRQKAGEMKRETSGIGSAIAGGLKSAAPALGVVAIGQAIKESLTRADDLADLKVALNETAETLQRVDFAAQQTASVGVEELAKSMIRLEKGLGDVENKAAADALANFGITAGELTRMPLDEKLIALSAAFQKARSEGTGVSDIMDLLGRSGASLIPMLGQSEEALRDLFASAPVVADSMIDRMAELNDKADGLVAKVKSNVMSWVGLFAHIGTITKDIFATGSYSKAMEMAYDREVETAKKAQEMREQKEAQAAAIEAAKAAEAEAKAAKEAADARERSAALIERLKSSIEQKELDVLPDEEKLAALEKKYQEMFPRLQKQLAGFWQFDNSAQGLEKLALWREGIDSLPVDGKGSAAEAYEWLVKARDLEAEIADLKEKTGKEDVDRAKKRLDELEAARKRAEEGGFALLDPEQQAAKLREQLEASLGFKVGSASDIDRGIAEQRAKVESARARGDQAAEKEALDRLNESQQLAKEFTDAAQDLAPEAPAGGVGSLAGLVNQMFGRDPQAQQVEELRNLGTLAAQQRDRLDGIIKKMDEQPPVTLFGGF